MSVGWSVVSNRVCGSSSVSSPSAQPQSPTSRERPPRASRRPKTSVWCRCIGRRKLPSQAVKVYGGAEAVALVAGRSTPRRTPPPPRPLRERSPAPTSWRRRPDSDVNTDARAQSSEAHTCANPSEHRSPVPPVAAARIRLSPRYLVPLRHTGLAGFGLQPRRPGCHDSRNAPRTRPA